MADASSSTATCSTVTCTAPVNIAVIKYCKLVHNARMIRGASSLHMHAPSKHHPQSLQLSGDCAACVLVCVCVCLCRG